MLPYILAHWRGQLSLGVSYWVNGVLLGIAVFSFIDLFLDVAIGFDPFTRPSWAVVALLGAVAVTTTGFGLWQIVGIWRSAGRHMRESGRYFWAVIARVLMVLDALGLAGQGYLQASMLRTHTKLVTGRLLGDYAVTLAEDTEIRLRGDISFGALDEVERLLDENPAVDSLALSSAGGLVGAGFELAALVEKRDLTVIARGECISACTMPLMASRRPAAVAGTVIGFHRWFSLTAADRETQRLIDERFQGYLRRSDLTPDTQLRILSTGPREVWAPPFRTLIEEGIVRHIFDAERRDFMPAEAWCADNPAACDAEPELGPD